MNIGDNGLELIKSFEGLRLEAYKDTVGVSTIGYGHTRGVSMGMIITEEQANQYLIDDLQVAVSGVLREVRVPVSQNQFDALVSFVFNLGEGALAQSTLLKKLNAGDYAGASAEFPRWNKESKGGVLVESVGLTRRRNAEKALFLS